MTEPKWTAAERVASRYRPDHACACGRSALVVGGWAVSQPPERQVPILPDSLDTRLHGALSSTGDERGDANLVPALPVRA